MAADHRVGIGDLLDHAIDDGAGWRMQPVVWIDMQADGHVAHGLRDPDRHDLIARRRLCVAEKRSPEQPHRPSGQRLEQPLVGVDLERHEAVGQIPEIGMGVGVIADIVALGEDPSHEIGIGLRVLADDEEARANVLLLQDIENLRRPVRIGTVVEGECELAGCRAGSLNDERGWHRLVGLIDDLTRVVVDIEGSLAGCGHLPHMQDLAIALKVDVLAGADLARARRGVVRRKVGRGPTTPRDLRSRHAIAHSRPRHRHRRPRSRCRP